MVWNEHDEVPERRQAMDHRLRELAERASDRYATVMVRFMLASNELMRGDLDAPACVGEFESSTTAVEQGDTETAFERADGLGE